MFYFVSIFLHGDSCPTGSANPEEGCESEGYQCGPDGCGNYIHGICQDCDQSSDDDDNVDDERGEDEDQQGSNPAKSLASFPFINLKEILDLYILLSIKCPIRSPNSCRIWFTNHWYSC